MTGTKGDVTARARARDNKRLYKEKIEGKGLNVDEEITTTIERYSVCELSGNGCW